MRGPVDCIRGNVVSFSTGRGSVANPIGLAQTADSRSPEREDNLMAKNGCRECSSYLTGAPLVANEHRQRLPGFANVWVPNVCTCFEHAPRPWCRPTCQLLELPLASGSCNTLGQ